MNIFSQLAAGDSATWSDDQLQDSQGTVYTSAGYTLTYSLRGGGEPLDLTATPKGTGWMTSITPTQSAALNTTDAEVTWWWQAYVSASGVRILAGEGSCTIRPNLAATGASYDGRTQEEKDLEAIRAEISARVNGGATLEYSIGNRHLKKEPIDALLKLEARYKLVVDNQRRSQQIKNGQGDARRSLVVFK